jgi:D-sedoheptulose 7-phosphate isomerase
LRVLENIMEYREIAKDILEKSIDVKKQFMSDEGCMDSVAKAAGAIVECYKRGGKVIIFGNGGSAADSQHFAAELVVRFEKERKALPSVALSTNTSVLTAGANDYSFDQVFSRQVEALAGENDVAVAISTSGNSPNVLEAVKKAAEKKIPVIALTGRDGGKLAGAADIPVIVKTESTARIQEVHVAVIHILCKIIEDSI